MLDDKDMDMSSVSDPALECARRPWPLSESDMPLLPNDGTRGAYGYFLHALEDLVVARREVPEVSSLESVKISIGRRVYGDFVPPDELRLWFEANVTTFEAPM